MSSPKKTCPRCGAENANHLRYCSMCGTSLAPAATAANPVDERGGGTSLVPRPAGLKATSLASPAVSSAPVNPVGPSVAPVSVPPAHYGREATDWAGSNHTPDAVPRPEVRVPRPAGLEPTNQALRIPATRADYQPVSARPAETRCWRCGTPCGPSAAFCQACGASLRDAGAQPVTSAAPSARLIVIAQDGTAGHEYPVVGGQIDIGRESGDVRISTDGYACPRHARLTWKHGSFWVTDLGSVNGVFVRLTGPERLQHGDVLLLGMGVLRFEIVTANETALAPAIERGTRLFGSPATPRYARLVERTVEGVARNVLYLSKNVVTIGRETGDIVFTDDPFMSRQHAGLERQSDGTFIIKDLGSSNGTFLAIRGERALPDGSHIRIGQHLFRLKIDGM